MRQISRRILFGAMLLLAVFSSACSKLKTEFGAAGTTAGFQCPGVQEDNPNFPITVVNNGTAISVSFPAATGGKGVVRYMMYSDTNFTELKDQTQNTTYLWQGVKPGDIVVVGVRCRDSRGESSNRNFVVINIPRTNDETPPLFDGAFFADDANQKQVILKWNECTDLDNDKKEVGHDCLYKVYRAENLTQHILSTPDTIAVIDGMTPATAANFVVRAEDANGNQEKNTKVKSVFMLGYVVPLFAPSPLNSAGITGVFRLPSVPGLSTLKLSWIEPEQTVLGYTFYQGNARDLDDQNFVFTRVAPTGAITSDPVVGPYIPAGITSADVPGLQSDTLYWFVVRAVNKVGSTMVTEFNRYDISNSTLKLEPVKGFAGIDYLKEGAGDQAYTEFTVGWPPVDLNKGGIHDSFRIDYMKDAKCVVDSKGTKSFPTSGTYKSVTAAGGATASGELVTQDVEGLKNYAVRVRAQYTGTPPHEDANTACLDVYTSPTPPVFDGIVSAKVGDELAAYTTIRAEWGKASGSFHRYYIQAATDAAFSKNLVTSTYITDIDTTTGTLTNSAATPILPNTLYYVRVVASFGTNPNELRNAGLPLPYGKVLTVFTQPPRPEGEKVTKIDITTPSSLVLTWQKPTNADAFFNEYRLVQKCAADPTDTGSKTYVNNELQKILDGQINDLIHQKYVDIAPHPATRQQAFAGLSADRECCFGVLSQYMDSNYLLSSKGPRVVLCGTPTLPAHPEVAINSVKRSSDSQGWTSATVYWTPFAKDGINEIRWGANSSYRVVVSKDSSLDSFKDCYALEADSDPLNNCTGSSADAGKGGSTEWGYVKETSLMANNSLVMNGLNGRNSWYFQLRTVNSNGSPAKITQSSVKALGPTPKAPFDDEVKSIVAIGQDSLRVVYRAPTRDSTDPDKQGTWNYAMVVLNTATGTNAPSTVQFRIDEQNKNKGTPAPPPYADGVNPLLDTQYDVAASGLILDANATAKTKAIFTIPRDNFAEGADNNIDILNLKAGVPACVHVIAFYKEPSKPDRYLPSLSTLKLADCATPMFNQPVGGYLDEPYEPLNGGANQAAFTTILPNIVAPVTGTCTRVEIMYAPAAAGANPFNAAADEPTDAQWRNPPNPWKRFDTGCSTTTASINGLDAHTKYYMISSAVAYKASNPALETLARTGFGTTGGPRRYGYRYTATKEPEGGDTTSITYVPIANDYDRIDLTFKVPGSDPKVDGVWDRIFVFKAVAADEPTARGLLSTFPNGAMWPASDKKSPNDVIYSDDKKGITAVILDTDAKSNPTWSDKAPITGPVHCYSAWPVYAPNAGGNITSVAAGDVTALKAGPYNAKGMAAGGLSAPIQCAQMDPKNYSTPSALNGAFKASLDATDCPDGSARIKIQMTDALTDVGADKSVEQYHVYIGENGDLSSFNLSGAPWQIVNKGDPTYDTFGTSTDVDNFIWVGCQGRTIAGAKNSFIVRYYYKGSDYTDSNQNQTANINIPSAKANFVSVPKSFTGLAYNMLMMPMEASIKNPADLSPLDAVETDTTKLGICNSAWRDTTKTTLAGTMPAECGTNASGAGAVAEARANSTLNAVTWAQAWWACRRATVPGALHVRLPTEEEWRRASRWLADDYAGLTSTHYNAGTCNLSSTVRKAGSVPGCANPLGLLDMAGNVREAVDNRMVQYVIPNGEKRTGYDYATLKTIGVTIDNYLDRLIHRYHLYDPGTSGAALWMGSSVASTQYTAGQSYPKPLDVETMSWRKMDDADVSNGFRCVAFLAGGMPSSLDVFELPREPVYQSNDAPATLSKTTIPPTKYVKDDRWERVTIPTSAYSNPAQGTVHPNGAPYYNVNADNNIVFESGLWTKPSCASETPIACSSFKHYWYRMREPVRVDIRGTIPWSYVPADNSNNTYSKEYAFDPLGVILSGSSYLPLWTNVSRTGTLQENGVIPETAGGVAQSTCNSSTTTNFPCSITHSLKDGSGANEPFPETKRLYDFILVVEDQHGNKMPARVQRFRSPYFVGLTQNVSTATPQFRREDRFRRVGVFPMDDVWQEGTNYGVSALQVMAYVPMHSSGMDHDYFVQKYEMSQVTGGTVDSSNSGVPLAESGGVWSKNIAECHESFLRTGNEPASGCSNATTAISQSRRGVTPKGSMVWGSMFRMCRNSDLVDGDKTEAASARGAYPLRLLTSAEWTQAADWGDITGGTTIQTHLDSSLVGLTVYSLEKGTSGTSDGCNAGNVSIETTDNGTTASKRRFCQSRYGAFGIVGNVAELSAERRSFNTGLDNGIDGLTMGVAWRAGTVFSSTMVDLTRGFFPPNGSEGANYAGAGNNRYYGGNIAGIWPHAHGGRVNDPTLTGRFWTDGGNAQSDTAAFLGSRCGF